MSIFSRIATAAILSTLLPHPSSGQSLPEYRPLPTELVEQEGLFQKKYCTVANTSGSYDIELTDHDDNIVAVFDRICIIYREVDTESGKSIISRFSAEQKSNKFYNNENTKYDIIFTTEFFSVTDPDVQLAEFWTARFRRDCDRQTPYIYDKTTEFGQVPAILPEAADRGILHIRHYFYTAC